MRDQEVKLIVGSLLHDIEKSYTGQEMEEITAEVDMII